MASLGLFCNTFNITFDKFGKQTVEINSNYLDFPPPGVFSPGYIITGNEFSDAEYKAFCAASATIYLSEGNSKEIPKIGADVKRTCGNSMRVPKTARLSINMTENDRLLVDVKMKRTQFEDLRNLLANFASASQSKFFVVGINNVLQFRVEKSESCAPTKSEFLEKNCFCFGKETPFFRFYFGVDLPKKENLFQPWDTPMNRE